MTLDDMNISQKTQDFYAETIVIEEVIEECGIYLSGGNYHDRINY